MIPSNFDRFVKTTVGFAHGSNLSEVPEDPGVYAWFFPFEAVFDQGLKAGLSSLEKSTEQWFGLMKASGLIGQHQVSLERVPPGFDLSKEFVEKLDSTMTASDLEPLSVLLLSLSILASPIYVGMTRGKEGLRSRLQQHLSAGITDPAWTGSLRGRLAEVLSDPDVLRRCVVAYVRLPVDDDEINVHRLIEHVLIRVLRPVQSYRG